MNIHLSLVPYIKAAGELKTKPTQHSVQEEAIGRFRRAFPAEMEVKEDGEQPFLEHQIVNGEVDVGILMTNRTIRQEAFDTELLDPDPLAALARRQPPPLRGIDPLPQGVGGRAHDPRSLPISWIRS